MTYDENQSLDGRLRDVKVVATHNQVFHADDAFAIATLKLLKPEIKIIRTSKPEELSKADMRVDVGKKYSPETGDYDHHQAQILRENGVPYASFGLIWKDLGAELCGSEELASIIEKILVEPIDAYDTGFTDFSPENELVKPVLLQQLISHYNPLWNEEQDYDAGFEKAVTFASEFLQRKIKAVKSNVEAESIVRKSIEESKNAEYKGFIFIDLKSIPWSGMDCIANDPSILYVIQPSRNNGFVITAAPSKAGSFQNKKLFPAEWAGKSGADLARTTGVRDAEFCHTARFVAGSYSLEGAIAMTQKAVDYQVK
ncbi:MYG1 family protein [Candidatus Woesearchaeota archaeon]|nr:MYG1 family protein [Candidatus Woesearchaeota archaeon]